MLTIEIEENAAFTPNSFMRPGWYVMWTPDNCESCGVEAQGPNSINVQLGGNTHGLDIRETLPGELGYCETFGGAVCWDCHDSLQTPK